MITIKDPLVKAGLILSGGVLLLTLGGGLLRFIIPDIRIIWIIPLLCIIWLLNTYKLKVNSIRNISRVLFSPSYILVYAVLILGIISQNLVMYRGGWKSTQGYIFPSMHDTMWSLSISAELLHRFPPQHPGFSGEILKNHHFFYPLLLAHMSTYTGITLIDLYFRYGPLFVSLLFGLSLYAISGIFSRKKHFQALTVFLGYFSGSFAYLVPFVFPHIQDWKGNTFLSDQPFDQIINPYSVLGFAFFLFGAYLLHQISVSKIKNPFGLIILCALFIGSLYGFKAFGGVIAMGALVVCTFFQFIIEKKSKYIYLISITSVFFILIFSFITNSSSASLSWSPGWMLTELMVSTDKLNLPHYADTENYYRSIGNIFGLFKIKIIEFLIYFTGNFGIRLVGLGYLVILFVKGLLWNLKRAQNKTHNKFFIIQYLLVSLLISFSVPLLFNLGSNAHNIVQFTPYALVIAGIFTGLATEQIFVRSLRISYFLSIIIIILIITLAIPVNVKNILTKIEQPKDTISFDEYEALEFIKNNTISDAVLIIDPRQFSINQMYIPAISQRRVYLANSGYAYQTGIDPTKRLEKLTGIFDAQQDITLEFENKEHIDYLYHIKPVKNLLLENFIKRNTQIIYDSDSVSVYKLNKT